MNEPFLVAHPWLAWFVCCGSTLLGALGGVGLAYLSQAERWASPDNALAGLAFGYGGVMVGILVGVVLFFRMSRD
jgi:hypothetical protein